MSTLKVIIFITISAVHILLAVHIYRRLFFRKKKSIEDELRIQITNGLISENYYEELNLNKIIIDSEDNYKLAGYIVKCENPIGCIILSHGISCSHATMLWNVELLKRNTNIPILFIHGTNDSVIPSYMSKAMAEVTNNEIFYINNCGHYIHKDIKPSLFEYENIISNFLSKIRNPNPNI